jgi:hypothetical protein
VGARFSAFVQTGSRAHDISFTLGTGSVIPEGKAAEVKDRVEIIPCAFRSGYRANYLIPYNFTFTFNE